MDAAQFLAVPENRATVMAIIRGVEQEIAPEEIEVTAELWQPLFEAAIRGQAIPAATGDEAGRFGAGFDLTIQVVVPAVVTLLANALSACGREALSALRGRNRQEIAELLELQTGAVMLVIRRTGSKRLRRRQPEIVRAVMAAAKRELGAGEERGAR